MGVILSRFRKKKSTLEVLEGLEKNIKSIEEYGQSTERQHKAVVGRLVLVSVGLYVLTACLFYFFFFPASLYDQLLYVIPLLLFPLIIIFVKRLVSWWYRRKISRNQEKLCDMKNQKKELLEEVMDKETYKIARQILEKYAPEHLRKTSATSTTTLPRANLEPGKFSSQLALSPRTVAPGSPAGSPGTELRRRPAATQLLASPDNLTSPQGSLIPANPRSPPSGVIPSGHVMSSEFTPLISTVPGTIIGVTDPSATTATSMSTTADAVSVAAAKKPDVVDAEEEEEDIDNDQDNDEAGKDTTTTAAAAVAAAAAEVADDKGENHVDDGPRKGGVPPPSLRLTRPILPRERSVMDRLVEYLVGDGVNQRYALVCRNCGSHNGMALKEEFEYLAFRCCYCFHWNPARKQRLQAPRLEAAPSSGNTTSSSTDSNTEEEDESTPQPKRARSQGDEKEIKSEPLSRIPSSTGSSDGINPIKPEYADSQSSTEDLEFESLVPELVADIPPGQEDAESL